MKEILKQTGLTLALFYLSVCMGIGIGTTLGKLYMWVAH